MRVALTADEIRVGDRFRVTCQRTLRIPDDGRTYPLPPGLGKIPIEPYGKFPGRLPLVEKYDHAFFIPMFQREALWLGFEGAVWKPNAVKIGVGGRNAITGAEWDERLHAEPQNYVVVPDQPWLDGINVGSGVIRQFVAVALGSGYSVEAQLSHAEESGGLHLMVFEPRAGRFPDRAPPRPPLAMGSGPNQGPDGRMGLGAGGRMQQRIYPDRHGIDTWDPANHASVFIQLINSETYREVTGREPPPTSISARTYTEYGLPWFRLYDESRGDVEGATRLREVQSVRDLDDARGVPDQPDDESVDIDDSKIRELRLGGDEATDDAHER